MHTLRTRCMELVVYLRWLWVFEHVFVHKVNVAIV